MVLARGKKVGTFYITSNSRSTITIADVDGKTKHQRLGHMSNKGMKVLLSKGKLPSVKPVDTDLCEDCTLDK